MCAGQLQDIPKSAERAPSRCFYTFKADTAITCARLVGESFRSLSAEHCSGSSELIGLVLQSSGFAPHLACSCGFAEEVLIFFGQILLQHTCMGVTALSHHREFPRPPACLPACITPLHYS
jgi:hypothetical protein